MTTGVFSLFDYLHSTSIWPAASFASVHVASPTRQPEWLSRRVEEDRPPPPPPRPGTRTSPVQVGLLQAGQRRPRHSDGGVCPRFGAPVAPVVAFHVAPVGAGRLRREIVTRPKTRVAGLREGRLQEARFSDFLGVPQSGVVPHEVHVLVTAAAATAPI